VVLFRFPGALKCWAALRGDPGWFVCHRLSCSLRARWTFFSLAVELGAAFLRQLPSAPSALPGTRSYPGQQGSSLIAILPPEA
jgi:hypothetical protein